MLSLLSEYSTLYAGYNRGHGCHGEGIEGDITVVLDPNQLRWRGTTCVEVVTTALFTLCLAIDLPVAAAILVSALMRTILFLTFASKFRRELSNLG